MKTARSKVAIFLALFTLMVFSGCFVNFVSAQILGPPNVLGSQSSSSGIFVISSPQNKTYNTQAIPVNFTVTAYNDIYDVGYSVDNRPIQKVTNLLKVSEVSAPNIELPPYIQVTYQGTLTLTDLSEGNHILTIYQGYQYTGINARYDIGGYASAVFKVDTAPKPSPPAATALPAENASLSDEQMTSTPQQPNFSFSAFSVLAVVLVSIVSTVLAFYVVYHKSEKEKP